MPRTFGTGPGPATVVLGEKALIAIGGWPSTRGEALLSSLVASARSWAALLLPTGMRATVCAVAGLSNTTTRPERSRTAQGSSVGPPMMQNGPSTLSGRASPEETTPGPAASRGGNCARSSGMRATETPCASLD